MDVIEKSQETFLCWRTGGVDIKACITFSLLIMYFFTTVSFPVHLSGMKTHFYVQNVIIIDLKDKQAVDGNETHRYASKTA